MYGHANVVDIRQEVLVPRFKVDLHNHTPLLTCDYRGSLDTTPRQIVEAALAADIDVYAVTDHFSVDFCARLAGAADEVAAETGRRLLVAPGAELKVRHGDDEVHVLALLPPEHAANSFAALTGILGLTTPVAPVCELHRVTVAYDPREVFRIIEALGGLGIVAHIDRAFGTYRLLDSPFADILLSSEHVRAAEVIDYRHAEMLRGYNLSIVSSSDSHSNAEIGRRRAHLEMDELSFEALRDAFASPVALAV
jgi:PHP family Zn ribbon phosphoesterase